jgi:hypothetical protein
MLLTKFASRIENTLIKKDEEPPVDDAIEIVSSR